MPYVAKLTNAGGVSTVTRYTDMLAGNAAFNPASYESIATLSGTGSAGAVTFTSIPSTYQHLQLRGYAKSASSTGSQFYTRLNNDGSGSSYATHYIYSDGSGINGGSGGAPTSVNFFGGMPSSTDTGFCSFVIDILDYANTSKNKTTKGLTSTTLTSGGGNNSAFLSSSVWLNTAAVTSVSFVANVAFSTTSRFYLYGIK
jgi:hypothetical protein